MSSTDYLLHMVATQKQGKSAGIYSICSANRYVLEAAMLQALKDNTPVLIESTSNQVNQFGGYTGMTARQFADYVAGIAETMKFPKGQIIFGGDHLGPNAWQKEPAKIAMEKSVELVRSCVLAGYTKIHLDASMRCADDPTGPLAEETVTARAAEMAAAAEEAYRQLPADSAKPVYVIGTEVPIPGGEQTVQDGVAATTTADATRTIERNKQAFFNKNLHDAWTRVIGVVVQPGVEFGDNTVFAYDRQKAAALSKMIEPHTHLIYEAHSTDYQTPGALRELVQDHFAILKVGPWLTFALREAVFALAAMEDELLGGGGENASHIRDVLDTVMLENPKYWQPYYHGDDAAIRYARKYSYSDRSRYYWPQPKLDAALKKLITNLDATPLPLTLLSQYMPLEYYAIRTGQIQNTPMALIHHKVMEVTRIYAAACYLI